MVVTFFINVALTSAAGTAAAVGAIIIPMLIRIGVHPAAAGTAVFAGTWGNVLSPGSVHPAFIAKLVNSDPMAIIIGHAKVVCLALALIAAIVFALTLILEENKGYVVEGTEDDGESSSFKANPLMAMVPVIPLVLLVLGSKQIAVLPPISVPVAMFAGAALALALTRKSPQELSRQFFLGMGDAYASVIGLIAAAAAFTQGMSSIGLTGALIDIMKHSTDVARLGASLGPLLVAFLSGSGDAATLAFNGSVTPEAARFGFDTAKMGSLAFIAGTLGRTMSPVAAACIISARLAGVGPVDLAKRTAPAMMAATILCTLMLL